MVKNELPLKEKSIQEIFNTGKITYEIPVYQRNYAWGKDEISALVQDVYDAMNSASKRGEKDSIYYIGTLVTYNKGDNVFEVIDGQQRLTTISLVLKALDIKKSSRLTYRARKRSDDTLKWIDNPDYPVNEIDHGIDDGLKFAKEAINGLLPDNTDMASEEYKNRHNYCQFFLNHVHLIHYEVPRDIDLNHYFEVMNSRGEQLEQHEIVKSILMGKLSKEDGRKFAAIWNVCSHMNVYIQQQYKEKSVFGDSLSDFKLKCFDDLSAVGCEEQEHLTIRQIMGMAQKPGNMADSKKDPNDRFQAIIDFPNFLLIVLKVTLVREGKINQARDITLDDKELLRSFRLDSGNENFSKKFGYNLLKAKYLLDNFIVHHANEEDQAERNPWKLQYWVIEKRDNNTSEGPRNIAGDEENDGRGRQNLLVHLLSMFEVSFTAKQRKNYLFYCLLYLFDEQDLLDSSHLKSYADFLEKLARKYFEDIYLNKGKLNSNNIPLPNSFDSVILTDNGKINLETSGRTQRDFLNIYGNGEESIKKHGTTIPLFVFNYLDFRIWKLYVDCISGNDDKTVKTEFFNRLGCEPFEDFRKFFRLHFYFSRTRRSLEHYFPRANVKPEDGTPTESQINCFGNFAMIGAEANSAGSNWTPKTKLDTYLDKSGKINRVSVLSPKFMIMMQICKDNYDNGTRGSGNEWNYEDIKKHQQKMMDILFPGEGT